MSAVWDWDDIFFQLITFIRVCAQITDTAAIAAMEVQEEEEEVAAVVVVVYQIFQFHHRWWIMHQAINHNNKTITEHRHRKEAAIGDHQIHHVIAAVPVVVVAVDMEVAIIKDAIAVVEVVEVQGVLVTIHVSFIFLSLEKKIDIHWFLLSFKIGNEFSGGDRKNNFR